MTSSRNSSSTAWLFSSYTRSLSFGSSWDGPGFSSASICASILGCSWCATRGIGVGFCVIASPKDHCFASLTILARPVRSKLCPWVATSHCCKVAPALSISSSIIRLCPHYVLRICLGSFIISASIVRFFSSNQTVTVHLVFVIVSPFPNFYSFFKHTLQEWLWGYYFSVPNFESGIWLFPILVCSTWVRSHLIFVLPRHSATPVWYPWVRSARFPTTSWCIWWSPPWWGTECTRWIPVEVEITVHLTIRPLPSTSNSSCLGCSEEPASACLSCKYRVGCRHRANGCNCPSIH